MKTNSGLLWTGQRTKVFTPFLIGILLVTLGTSRLRADKCLGTTSVAASNQHYKIEGLANSEQRSWSYTLTNLKTKQKRTGPLPLIKLHAHLYFFISQDGKHFAVLDASAGHHLTNRFMVYQADGKLVSSLGIQDVLTPREQRLVEKTVSHISWLGESNLGEEDILSEANQGGPKKEDFNPYGQYRPTDNTVSLKTLAGRGVVISLDTGKVIRGKKRRLGKR